jgi:undecaprenyl-diphosphatase
VLHHLADLDNFAIEATQTIRWQPLTALFVAASAWWVKWPLIAVFGAISDSRRRCGSRVCALSASIAAGVGALAAAFVKVITDRARPPLAESSVVPLIPLPDSTSFPSGHAATAFAAATAVALVYPRFRVPVLALASLVALSRVYLGVHYWSDVVVGSVLGVAVGWATVYVVRRVVSALSELRGSRNERCSRESARVGIRVARSSQPLRAARSAGCAGKNPVCTKRARTARALP